MQTFALFFPNHSGASQQEKSTSPRNINPVSNRIPEFRNVLPFVNQPRCQSFKKRLYVYFCHLKGMITNIWIRKIKNTLCNLFASCSLSTPFWAFNKNGPHGVKFSGKNPIRYSIAIFLHKV